MAGCERGYVMKWIIWDVNDVYAMARNVREFLVSGFTVLIGLFFVCLLVSTVIRLIHDYFGKDGLF